MLATQLAGLTAPDPAVDPGIEEALDLVGGFDDAFTHGFARLGEQPRAALAALAGAVAVTPLGERVREGVEKIVAGSLADEHLTALAGGRAALLGAVHDALLARLDGVLGRSRASWAVAGPADPATPPDNVLAGCRSWLRELAIAGWRGVDHDLVAASAQTLDAVLAAPSSRRLAVLLDGLAAELRACCPVATMDRLPTRRWADLWSRALLLAQPGGWPVATATATAVSGRLLPLGADVHEHGTAIQIQVHAVLEPAGDAAPRLVRTSVSAAKVETITGPAVWRLLADHPVLLGALAKRHAVEITDLPLLPSGDLLWRDDQARPDAPADPFATARLRLPEAVAPAVPPLDRHPVRLAEPVLLEDYSTTVDDSGGITLELGGNSLPVDVSRLPTCAPLTPESVARSSACLGLLRWDAGRWRLQPLAVQYTVKRATAEAHTGDWALGPTDPKVVKAEAKAGDAVAVLRERAGRLLRR
ncbi:hypothetical protein [Plantactinospora endophytica]|uniref:Uncharacterized protein n=1 Tax=Plantactinospora endophytica TaxID=673535 RepID=A0ABQ4E1T2_9ACTN|nr:hypothetical protein [Plantactinospora endophytica]GIG88670.1 hypothetical protein Pen02_36060 [Plantactinospora endophytica]